MGRNAVQEEYDDSSEEEEEDQLQDEDDPRVFKIRNLVPGPDASYKTMEELNQMVADGDIDLNPEYQRDVVWTKQKQISLIDSVWSNAYIPPLLLNRVEIYVEGEGKVPVLVCIDGKQRLTSIHNFMTGQIPHKDSVTKRLWWLTAPESARSSRLVIPEGAREEFSERKIPCVIYHNLKPHMEREIFQRVQEGVPLTSAERLQAIASPLSEWLGGIERKFMHSEGGIASLINLDTKRARDFQDLAHLVYCCEGVPEEERFATSAKITPWMSSEEAPTKKFEKAIENTLRGFVSVATDKKYNQAFRTIDKKVAPVEFIFIGVLLYQLRKEENHAKGLAIHNLRRALREQFTDLRNNTRTVKVIWKYVKQLVADPLSPVEPVSEDAQKGTKGKGKGPAKTGGKGKGTKRKKEQEDEEDEEDEGRHAPRPKASSSKSHGPKAKVS